MVSAENVVASGSLGIEIALEAVAHELSKVVDYDPEKYPGAYFRLNDSAPLITVYRTGKYIITGAGSEEEAAGTRSEFLRLLTDHGILSEAEDEWYKIQNYVCMEDIGQQLDLSALAIGLGLEFTEYEPEQFPGLVYRPVDHDCVMLLFGSGKVIITGTKDVVSAEEAVTGLLEEIDDLF
ncbi:TATA-box-binding protein [Haloferax volcanii]|uniref:TATA-box-binding protein n=1 Tax=Haloferax volcanii TaxID=2246 RepID=A0A558GDJ7_HALVO|nr:MULTISPECIES: TATA-box-binding protein [Haloferax]QIB79558.1 TATA-box-binding protein [Haloferax alexandrinus]TVT95835.1 TATA-box-binding protein [Haloferax volcanii]